MLKRFSLFLTATILLYLGQQIEDSVLRLPKIKLYTTHLQVSSVEGQLLTQRIRPRPSWLNRIPRRSFNGWIDEAQGIYRTRQGSIIGPYRQLAEAIRNRPAWLGTLRNQHSLEAHHLIERRVASAFGFDVNDIPAVVLTRQDHRGVGDNSIHNLIQRFLPRGTSATGSLTYRQRWAQIQQAYQQAYRSHPDWLDAITAIMSR
jgi:hypothetical protein